MNEITPYLCGGTFLTQLIETGHPRKSPKEHASGKKESHPEHEVLGWLIAVYRRDKYHPTGDSLKTNTSQYKRCQKSLASFIGFNDNELLTEFDNDVKTASPSTALYMMSELIDQVIDRSNYDRLAKRLLGLIKCDTSIPGSDIFYLSSHPITKNDLVASTEIDLAAFLLGIWHYIILHRANKNEYGAATFQAWFPQDGSNHSGDVAWKIKQRIYADFHPISKPEEDFHQSEQPHPSVECDIEEEDAQSSEKQELHQTLNFTPVIQNGLVNNYIGHVEFHKH